MGQVFKAAFGTAVFAILVAAGTQAEVFTYHHESVLGTDLELRVRAATESDGAAAEARVLAELDRLSAILSRHDPASEFAKWQAGRRTQRVSRDLEAVLAACDTWRARTGGAFDPAITVLETIWQKAAAEDRWPMESEVRGAHARAAESRWHLDAESGRATPGKAGAVSLDGLAKGYIIDAACDAAMCDAAIDGVLVNIGGDLRVRGALGVDAEVADPFADSLTGASIARTLLHDGAMATSGATHRYFEIAGKRYSHLFDPRSAAPASGIASATVIAPRAADADALATALNILSPEEGTALIDSIDGAAALVVANDGTVTRSARWTGPAPERIQLAAGDTPSTAAVGTNRWVAGYQLQLDFELANPETDGRYRRPYVGIWICDDEGFPVRTLVLWRQKDGLRWLPSLREWYRDDVVRAFVDPTDLIRTVSRSTRPPGQYSVLWDGRDDAGNLVSQGRYTLYLEAAREHGTHQTIREAVTLGREAHEKELEGNVEISGARIVYGPGQKSRS